MSQNANNIQKFIYFTKLGIISILYLGEIVEIEIIKAIQSIHNSVWDTIFYIITLCGEQMFFLAVFALLYWCFSKSSAIRLGLIYCLSAIINNVTKIIVKRPRPYVADESIRNIHTATGYSFPSGHSQSYSVIATEIGYDIFRNSKKKSHRITYIIGASILGILVALSRMYLGQHYLTDVICGLLFGAVIVVLCELFISLFNMTKKLNILYVLYVGIVICFIAIIILIATQSSHTSIYKYLCLFLGVSIGHILNEKVIHFDPKTTVANKYIIAITGYIFCAIIYLLFGLIGNEIVSTSLVHFFVSFSITAIVPLFAKWLERRKSHVKHSNIDSL